MRTIFPLAAATLLATTSLVAAQTSDRTPGPAGATMNAAQCKAVWRQADTGNAGSLTGEQAKGFVTDMTKVDKNSDGKISSSEFLEGCEKNLITTTAQEIGPSTTTR